MRKLLFSLLASVILCSSTVSAVSAEFSLPNSGFRPSFKNVKSMGENRFVRVVKQQYDYSCGAASLATLLTYHYNRKTEEMDVINGMLQIGDQKKIMKEGFSLLDMKVYLQTLGIDGEGYKAPLKKLETVGIPAIVLLNLGGYMHFVVVKGIDDQDVLIGDPTRGLKVMKRHDFESAWNGILFVVTNNKALGKKNFNNLADWKVINKVPLSALNAVNPAISSFTVQTSITPNYY